VLAAHRTGKFEFTHGFLRNISWNARKNMARSEKTAKTKLKHREPVKI
jgi:hypothetical protein